MKIINTPVAKDDIKDLKVNDTILLNGKILVARDAAHQRLIQSLNQENVLPIDLNNQVIYYMGPTPTPPGKIIGSCGPTSSYRMDSFTPPLLENGVSIVIGKGRRSPSVIESLKQNGSLYCVITGGIGALAQQCVKSSKVLLYPDLGPEAILELEVKDLPLIVAIDTKGNNIFDQNLENYKNLWKNRRIPECGWS